MASYKGVVATHARFNLFWSWQHCATDMEDREPNDYAEIETYT